MSVLVVYAADTDLLQNREVTYSIEDPLALHYFSLDNSSGLLQVAAPADRETVNNFTFNVKAMDAGVPPLWDMASVTITVSASQRRPNSAPQSHPDRHQKGKI